MIRAFIDASVLFAATYSETGASREIFQRAIRGEIDLVISQLVLDEVARNLQSKAPELVVEFTYLRDVVALELVYPTRRKVEDVMEYCAAKDAAIVAAAKAGRVDYLVSLDRRHLVDAPEVAAASGVNIVLPGELLQEIRKRAGN